MIKHGIKKTINQIVSICIDKEITVNVYPDVKSISVLSGDEMYSAYYSGPLYNNPLTINETNFTLLGLLKKVKSL